MTDSNRDDREREPAHGTDGEIEHEAHTPSPAADVDAGTSADDLPDRQEPRDGAAIADEERRRKAPVFSALIAALGVWVAVSALLVDIAAALLWNNLLVGSAVFIAAGYNVYQLSNDVPLSTGVASLVAVLGIWLIISPALLEMVDLLFWSTLISGLLIAGFAGYNAYNARGARRVVAESTRA
ncbi:SPW repeat domain-containing protein [Natronorubrum sulfidifaciens]|uniref:SPW repeat-containing integral membrane domain-containing protein n=1 Tax=Natronorubrum sulfidifaciens JCM 14089 TaxID=1230460 RepID=L9WCL4_9EURY|nr:hypothetical protein [Natronorubrum sulfidifaciens]ELY47245.1 hypothetical protein C495_03267 [Natronorubrum sulfidifaciens JCM 14089]